MDLVIQFLFIYLSTFLQLLFSQVRSGDSTGRKSLIRLRLLPVILPRYSLSPFDSCSTGISLSQDCVQIYFPIKSSPVTSTDFLLFFPTFHLHLKINSALSIPLRHTSSFTSVSPYLRLLRTDKPLISRVNRKCIE